MASVNGGTMILIGMSVGSREDRGFAGQKHILIICTRDIEIAGSNAKIVICLLQQFTSHHPALVPMEESQQTAMVIQADVFVVVLEDKMDLMELKLVFIKDLNHGY